MKTDKTDIIFKKMNKDINDVETYYEFKQKEIIDNKYIENEEKNAMLSDLKIQRSEDIKNIKVKHTDRAIKLGYTKTTQDISMLLDLDPGFCTRHIKDYIDFIRIPSETSSLFKSYLKFNVIEQVELSKKKLLFNTDSLYKLIKENLYEVDNFISIKISNIDSLIEEKDELYICKKLAKEYIEKITKENEYRTPITDEQFNDIKENNITLLRQDTLKTLISQLILREKITVMKRKLDRDLGKDESDFKTEQEEILNNYTRRILDMSNTGKVLADLSLLKEGNMTHQTQIIRRAKQLQHTRYHLMLPNRSQPINLYGIRPLSIEMEDIEESIEEIEDSSSIKVVISVHCLYENIEQDIYKYIEKNLAKARKNKDL